MTATRLLFVEARFQTLTRLMASPFADIRYVHELPGKNLHRHHDFVSLGNPQTPRPALDE